ncbi:MAG: carbonic anhydrase [Frankiales bacterium]|jgi:carbonic anhydrase|nr:carbonic anhydrase [Frankiales bacterium]
MTSFNDVFAANTTYAQTFSDAGIPGKAAKGLAVVTCMDSRISPLDLLGLQPGDAKILRNAGARVTDDVLRTLVLAVHLLDVDRVMVMPHTDCRMTKVTDEQVHDELLGRGIDTRSLEFRTVSNQIEELRKDVQKVRSSPYLPAGLPVVGAVYDVKTGLLDVAIPAE